METRYYHGTPDTGYRLTSCVHVCGRVCARVYVCVQRCMLFSLRWPCRP